VQTRFRSARLRAFEAMGSTPALSLPHHVLHFEKIPSSDSTAKCALTVKAIRSSLASRLCVTLGATVLAAQAPNHRPSALAVTSLLVLNRVPLATL